MKTYQINFILKNGTEKEIYIDSEYDVMQVYQMIKNLKEGGKSFYIIDSYNKLYYIMSDQISFTEISLHDPVRFNR